MVVSHTRARHLSIAAAMVLAGVVLSGPVAVGLVEAYAPQPPWHDAATFAHHYSWLQTLPYYFGFLIVSGFIFLMASLVGAGLEAQRPLEMAGVALTAVFGSLVSCNYVLQTGFVPQSLTGGESVIAAMTMANPRSLGWALEMYGYGFLGVATAVVAPLFHRHGRQGAIRGLLIANGVVSVVSAFLVPIVQGWVLTPMGMVAGSAWNVLIAILMTLMLLEFRFGRNI